MECTQTQSELGVLPNKRFECVSALNHGSYGMVFLAKDHHDSGRSVAVKRLTKWSAATLVDSCTSSAFTIDDRSEELTIHRALSSHPNIVGLVDSFETEHHVYIVLELCPDGDLYDAIRLGRGPKKTEDVRNFMLQLISAVDFMHATGYFHRDIKPENIFLTHDGHMKLGDFGLATKEKESSESAGSELYMAPEQFDCKPPSSYSTPHVDIWAIGICLLKVLFYRNPFVTPTPSDPRFRDFARNRESLFDIFPTMSKDTYEVLRHCLAIDPESRSLTKAREAVERVVSFTDDESLDDLCDDDDDPVAVASNRESAALTPSSLSTATLPKGSAFSWASALATIAPAHPVRQLSTIRDGIDSDSDDSLFESGRAHGSWYSLKPDRSSVVSFVDSGLGLSLESDDGAQSRPIEKAASKPPAAAGSGSIWPLSSWTSIFGSAKADTESKSWSELWEEEEQENALGQVKTDVKGHVRGSGSAALAELEDPASAHNNRDIGPPAAPHRDISEQTGFIFEDVQHLPPAPPKEQRKPIVVRVQHQLTPARTAAATRYSPPQKRSGFDMTEKWAALGDRRRAQQQPSPSPAAAKSGKPILSTLTHLSAFKRQKNMHSAGWKKGIASSFTKPHDLHESEFGVAKGSMPLEYQKWNLSKDWRDHPASTDLDDIGDLEWVGGWHHLHL